MHSGLYAPRDKLHEPSTRNDPWAASPVDEQLWVGLTEIKGHFVSQNVIAFLVPSWQTQRNVTRFRLHSHALRAETRSWEHHDGTCDKCGLQAIQDENHQMENHALFLCPCMQMCLLRLQFADLFHHWHTKLLSIRLELFISPKLVLKMSSNFSRNKLMISIVLFQSLWTFFFYLTTTNTNLLYLSTK